MSHSVEIETALPARERSVVGAGGDTPVNRLLTYVPRKGYAPEVIPHQIGKRVFLRFHSIIPEVV
jgi:hypothetical protein